MAQGTVKLVNAVFYAHHGVKPEEHSIGARFEVDVSMDLDFTLAAQRDALTGTVDYELVYQWVQEIVLANRFDLIERLAYLIAEKILAEYAFLDAVVVTVRKPHPPLGGTCDRAEVVYRAGS